MAAHFLEGRRGLAWTAILGMTLMLGGCERMLDIDKAEAAIKSGLADQLQMPFASVECPESRAIKAGDAFECTAVAETGGDLTVKVTQKDDTGAVNWEVTNGDKVLSLTSLEEMIEGELARQLKVDAAVDCGGKMRLSVPAQTFECKASAGAESRPVVVTMKDDKGNVSWALK